MRMGDGYFLSPGHSWSIAPAVLSTLMSMRIIAPGLNRRRSLQCAGHYRVSRYHIDVGDKLIEWRHDITSAIVQVFGCRHAETIPTLGQPASEKRQGTKSRGVRHRQCSGCYGDLASA